VRPGTLLCNQVQLIGPHILKVQTVG